MDPLFHRMIRSVKEVTLKLTARFPLLSRRLLLKTAGPLLASLSAFGIGGWGVWRASHEEPHVFRYTCRIRGYRSFAEHEADRSQWENLTYVNRINEEFRERGWLLEQARENRAHEDYLEIAWTYRFLTAEAARQWEYTMLANMELLWPKWGQAEGFESEIHRTYRI